MFEGSGYRAFFEGFRDTGFSASVISNFQVEVFQVGAGWGLLRSGCLNRSLSSLNGSCCSAFGVLIYIYIYIHIFFWL